MLYSSEATTQEILLAMPIYALSTIPHIEMLQCDLADVSQVWYADDASAARKIVRLCEWWSQLSTQGPKYGYFANATKTWLVTKVKHYVTATASFADTGVQVTSKGRPYLGAAFGTEEFVTSHVKEKVPKWIKELRQLGDYCLITTSCCPCSFHSRSVQRVILP